MENVEFWLVENDGDTAEIHSRHESYEEASRAFAALDIAAHRRANTYIVAVTVLRRGEAD